VQGPDIWISHQQPIAAFVYLQASLPTNGNQLEYPMHLMDALSPSYRNVGFHFAEDCYNDNQRRNNFCQEEGTDCGPIYGN